MLSNDTLSLIRARRSVRSFREEPVAPEQLEAILDAGKYAPNAGDQAWHFTAVLNRDVLERLNAAAKSAATASDLPWLKELGENPSFHCLYHAPLLVIVSADEQSPIPLDLDCAAAMENMLLAAESVGLSSCWIYFVLMAFSSAEGDGLRAELGIPQGYRPVCAAVFGHRLGDAPEAAERKDGTVMIIR